MYHATDGPRIRDTPITMYGFRDLFREENGKRAYMRRRPEKKKNQTSSEPLGLATAR